MIVNLPDPTKLLSGWKTYLAGALIGIAQLDNQYHFLDAAFRNAIDAGWPALLVWGVRHMMTKLATGQLAAEATPGDKPEKKYPGNPNGIPVPGT